MLNIALKMHSEWKEKIMFYVGIFTYISKSGSRAQLLNEINIVTRLNVQQMMSEPRERISISINFTELSVRNGFGRNHFYTVYMKPSHIFTLKKSLLCYVPLPS